jgi:hypothetical protein
LSQKAKKSVCVGGVAGEVAQVVEHWVRGPEFNPSTAEKNAPKQKKNHPEKVIPSPPF